MEKFSSFKVPKILYIHGVFLEDCKEIADVLEERLLEDSVKQAPVVKINKLPPIYYGVDTWIKKCDVECFYCDKKFDTMPIFIPKSIEKYSNGKFQMHTEACFDSWPCLGKFVKKPNRTDCRMENLPLSPF